jgi:hypothetical protein
MDDTTILDKAKHYVENLQKRVKELEQEGGSNMCNNKRTKKVNSNEYICGTNDNLPEVQVKVLQKEVLVIIHCEKQNDVILKILTHLENLHLSVVNSSVLRFGKSILDITIVAQVHPYIYNAFHILYSKSDSCISMFLHLLTEFFH